MLRTAVTDLLHIAVPVVGAPMAGVAGGRLAAAVSAGGGLGMIGVGSTTKPAWILAESQHARDAAHPFGIGLMAWALDQRSTQFDAAVEAHPRLVSVSFGDYAPWVGRLHDAGITVATQVGDVESARAAADHGVDVVVARGGEAGGHGSDSVATLPLLQGVLDAVDVPVLAAGGIATPRGLAAVLAAGAAGGWIGSALLACPEADTTPEARTRVCAAAETDTVYTRVFDIAQNIPWPPEYGGRALRNSFTDRWVGRESELIEDPEAHGLLTAARRAGDYATHYIYAGQAVGLLRQERSAADVVTSLAGGAAQLLSHWGNAAGL
jgi:nitronate monooxygenase